GEVTAKVKAVSSDPPIIGSVSTFCTPHCGDTFNVPLPTLGTPSTAHGYIKPGYSGAFSVTQIITWEFATAAPGHVHWSPGFILLATPGRCNGEKEGVRCRFSGGP